MTQGIIDQTLYSRETTALLAASEDIQKEIDRLENSASDVAGVLLEARALLHFAEKAKCFRRLTINCLMNLSNISRCIPVMRSPSA